MRVIEFHHKEVLLLPLFQIERIMLVNLARRFRMLRAAIVFFIIAIVAFIFGASGIAGMSMEIGRLLLMIFLALAIISFLINVIGGRRGQR